MAKGFDLNQARKDAVSMMGKTLARRSRSTCELCEATGVSLSAYEVPPVPAEPDVGKSLFICDTCKGYLGNPRREQPDHWRCLGNTMWSELPAVQVVAVRVLRRLADDYPWAAELAEQAFLDPEIEEWVAQG